MALLNQNLLKNMVSVKEYLSKVNGKFLGYKDNLDNYLRILPFYELCRCPYCNKKYIEKIDTYTLKEWTYPTEGKNIAGRGLKPKKCKHFTVVDYFINFNGILPEIKNEEMVAPGDFNSEVPHVLPFLLQDDINCKAVINSIPICKIIKDKFVPKYTLYMVFYFSSWFEKLKVDKRLNKHGSHLTDRLQVLLGPLDAKDEEAEKWWDLKRWVEKERLYWIEPNNSNLILKTGDVSKFPYGDIKGRKNPYYAPVPPYNLKR